MSLSRFKIRTGYDRPLWANLKWYRATIMAVLSAGVLLFLPGCWEQPANLVRIGSIPWPGYEPLFLARSLGLFDRVPFQLVEYPSTPEATRAFQNGALEMVALTGDEMLRLAQDDPDLRAVLVLDFSNGADAVVSREEFQDVHQLNGKKIGAEANAVGAFMLNRFLSSSGVQPSDVQIVRIKNDLHVEAFEQGQVDLLVTFEPHLSKIRRMGGRVLFDSSKIPGEIVDVLVTRKSVLEKREKHLKPLLDGWFAARDYLSTNRLNAASRVARRENTTPEEFLVSLQGVTIPDLATNQRLLGNEDGSLRKTLQRLQTLMFAEGLLQQRVRVDELLDDRLVREAR